MHTRAPLSTREVAALLGLSVPTVTRYARAGALPYVAKAPGARGAYLFDPAVIEARVEAAERAS